VLGAVPVPLLYPYRSKSDGRRTLWTGQVIGQSRRSSVQLNIPFDTNQQLTVIALMLVLWLTPLRRNRLSTIALMQSGYRSLLPW